jgi:hypothetical protein
MNAPLSAAGSQIYCRTCGYALIGLTSRRCPECGRKFNPSNPKSFLARPPRIILRRIAKLVLVLFCLTLPVDSYFGYLIWQVHQERKTIQFLVANGASVSTYDTTPLWAKRVLRGHAAWLWRRASLVDLDRLPDNTNNVAPHMAAVEHLKSLRFLYIWPAPATDSDLANLRDLTTLQRLDLHCTSVTDAGLVNLKGLTTLLELDLGDTSVTDASLANLKGLTALQTLSLDHTFVTDGGLANLNGLKALDDLYLGGTLVTDKGVAKLQASLSNCAISY